MSKTISKDSDSACIRIRGTIHKKIAKFCKERGYKIGFFMEFTAMKYIAGQEGK